jgi:hypothetical protein
MGRAAPESRANPSLQAGLGSCRYTSKNTTALDPVGRTIGSAVHDHRAGARMRSSPGPFRCALIPTGALWGALLVAALTAAGAHAATLTVVRMGDSAGAVTSSPQGIDCPAGVCHYPFPDGVEVTLHAHNNRVEWSGACEGSGWCRVTMNGDKVVTATFDHWLTVTASGSGWGRVREWGRGLDCAPTHFGFCRQSYPPGSQVDLDLELEHPSTFDAWSGACVGSGSCQIVMNGPKTVGASFNLVPGIGVVKVNYGGTVTSSPAGIDCTAPSTAPHPACVHDFGAIMEFTLTAAPAPGFVFLKWLGPCPSSTSPTCTLNTNDGRRVQAVFGAQVVVQRSGPGLIYNHDRVMSCGSTCSGYFPTGQELQLFTQFANGTTFNGWPTQLACNTSHPGYPNTCGFQVTGAVTIPVSFSGIDPTVVVNARPGGKVVEVISAGVLAARHAVPRSTTQAPLRSRLAPGANRSLSARRSFTAGATILSRIMSNAHSR